MPRQQLQIGVAIFYSRPPRNQRIHGISRNWCYHYRGICT